MKKKILITNFFVPLFNRELVSLLHANDVAVYLVSGGFYSIIEPVAKELHIPYKNIYANRIKFFYDGNYAGFDESEPTSQQHGKAKVIAYLKNRYKYRTVTIVGDGVTDMEAYPPAVRIIIDLIGIFITKIVAFFFNRMHSSDLVVIKYVKKLKKVLNGLPLVSMI